MLRFSNRYTRIALNQGLQFSTDSYRLPRRINEAGLVPAGHLPASVIDFTHQKISLKMWTIVGLPRFVGYNRLPVAVPILDLKLREQTRLAAIMFSLSTKTEIAGVPAVGKNGPDGVVAGRQQIRNIIGLIVHPLGIISPARREVILSYAPAIDMQFIKTKGRCINRCLLDRFVDRKGSA